MISVTILIPTLNEEAALPATLANVASLVPQPDEMIIVDGGSTDGTLALIKATGHRFFISDASGRAIQINAGVESASSEVVCILHADTLLPIDAVAVIRHTMDDPKTVLASFTPRIGNGLNAHWRTRWGTTMHNWAKTWYAPLLFRPHLFIQGCRLLFGDHAMFVRRADYLAVGGCDPETPVMEEADLCIKLCRRGRIRMVPRFVFTSDRRIAAWGPFKANLIYLKVGILWGLGAKKRLGASYPDVR